MPLTDVTIPESVEFINDKAFKGCASLTDITIPGKVSNIGQEAFKDCSKLEKITFLGTKEEWENALKGTEAIPSSVTIQCSNGSLTQTYALRAEALPDDTAEADPEADLTPDDPGDGKEPADAAPDETDGNDPAANPDGGAAALSDEPGGG